MSVRFGSVCFGSVRVCACLCVCLFSSEMLCLLFKQDDNTTILYLHLTFGKRFELNQTAKPQLNGFNGLAWFKLGFCKWFGFNVSIFSLNSLKLWFTRFKQFKRFDSLRLTLDNFLKYFFEHFKLNFKNLSILEI